MKIVNQNIPGELLDAYKRSLRQSTDWKPGANIYTVRTRQPFRLPHMQSNGGNSPSGAQLKVREAFNQCIECFNSSPKTGGETPPDIGYRSREWWYNEAGESGLWYYDYFIQQSWQPFFDGDFPDWCYTSSTTLPWDCRQLKWKDGVTSVKGTKSAGFIEWAWGTRDIRRSYHKIDITSLAGKKIAFWGIYTRGVNYIMASRATNGGVSYVPWNGVKFNICDPFDPGTITWENQPALRGQILLYPWPGGYEDNIFEVIKMYPSVGAMQAAVDRGDPYFYMGMRYNNDWGQIYSDSFCTGTTRNHGVQQISYAELRVGIK